MPEPAYHPGLEGVLAGETAISSMDDGLRYRGYSIAELGERATFEEVAYLLLHGELPPAGPLAAFRQRLAAAAAIPPTLVEILRLVPNEALMMDVLRSAASLLGTWDPDVRDGGHDANLRKAERLLAQLPVVLAAKHRLRHGLEPLASDPSLSFAGNLLWLLHGKRPSERSIQALAVTLIMYAELEFNASTFAARVVASTMSDLHACVTAAIGALKGRLHGGANERVMAQLTEVGTPERAADWVRDALARKVRIMGFGHRVYKTGDPRARHLRPFCAALAAESSQRALEETATTIEQIVLAEKGLRPNVDWPTARIYHYLGLPVDLYTPLFAISRIVGWSAHVIEQLDHNRLIRPRALYAGPAPRPWRPIGDR